MKFRTGLLTLATAGLLTFSGAVNAATIYNNSAHDLLTRYSPGALEVGNEISLAGTARWLTSFDFEYYGLANSATFAGPVQARVRFYLNDGQLFNGYVTPGTKFYDSDWFDVPTPTERNTFLFTAGTDFDSTGLYIPALSNMTWTVQFQGMSLGDEVGLDIYSPPTVGSSYGDFWQYNGTSWALMANNTSPMTFAATMEASPTPVPEPGSLTLVALAAATLLSLRKTRRS